MGTVEEKARFDTRLLKTQKEKFEKAAALAGFKNLSEFIVTTVNEKAEKIIEKHEAILTTEKDRMVFFEAMLNPPAPGKGLKDAAQRFREFAIKSKNDTTNGASGANIQQS